MKRVRANPFLLCLLMGLCQSPTTRRPVCILLCYTFVFFAGLLNIDLMRRRISCHHQSPPPYNITTRGDFDFRSRARGALRWARGSPLASRPSSRGGWPGASSAAAEPPPPHHCRRRRRGCRRMPTPSTPAHPGRQFLPSYLVPGNERTPRL